MLCSLVITLAYQVVGYDPGTTDVMDGDNNHIK